MTTGYLVNPDLSHRVIEFELDQANQFLGGTTKGRVSVAFQEDGSTYAALYSPAAREERAEPNPVASLARNTADTGNPAFLQDPIRAIAGPVIFVSAQEEEDDEESDFNAVIEAVDRGIRAVRNYKDDFPEEFTLWRAAVLNSSHAE